jgi:hypothetical protein
VARGAMVPVVSVIAAGACCFARGSGADSGTLVHWTRCAERARGLIASGNFPACRQSLLSHFGGKTDNPGSTIRPARWMMGSGARKCFLSLAHGFCCTAASRAEPGCSWSERRRYHATVVIRLTASGFGRSIIDPQPAAHLASARVRSPVKSLKPSIRRRTLTGRSHESSTDATET